jgi:hypothetical protein
VEDLAELARTRGWRVCVGRCFQFGELAWPLAPLVEIVGAVAQELDESSFDRVVGAAGTVLRRLMRAVDGNGTVQPVSTERLW